MYTVSEPDFNQLPYLFAWKNQDLKIMGCSQGTAKLIGFNSPEEVIGITDYEYKCKAAESAPILRQQDRSVIDNGIALRFLDIHPYADGNLKILLTDKMPLRDYNKNIIGSACFMTELNHKILANVIANLTNIYTNIYKTKNKNLNDSYSIIKKYNFNDLTKRESEIIFYLLMGKTARMIAKILYRSHRTIEHHIDNIKYKMNCKTKSDLIMCAIENGFLKCIPEGLLPLDTNLSFPIENEF